MAILSKIQKTDLDSLFTQLYFDFRS